jgi:hypothetical protein
MTDIETLTVRLDEYADHMHTVSSVGIPADALMRTDGNRDGWVKDAWSDWYYPVNLVIRLRRRDALDS